MIPDKELKFAYLMAAVLLILGIFSYAAFPAKPPDQPVRLMFQCVAGKVLFDHKTHTSDTGYGLSCQDCHHHPADDEEALRACGDCHNQPPEGETLPQACGDCHEADEIEGSEVVVRLSLIHI